MIPNEEDDDDGWMDGRWMGSIGGSGVMLFTAAAGPTQRLPALALHVKCRATGPLENHWEGTNKLTAPSAYKV